MARVNQFGQPIGEDLGDWAPPVRPDPRVLEGRTVVAEPLEWHRHGPALFEAFSGAPASHWTYMPYGPFEEPSDLEETISSMTGDADWLPYAVVVDGRPLGIASYLRIQPVAGVIEIGAITFAPPLQRTTPATEALYLMIRNVFEMGFRRCEWKCDALNEPSRRAGRRLGFKYEGTFEKATHYKSRSRDTAWFAIVDDEWPSLDSGFRAWLSPGNFDDSGAQKTALRDHLGRGAAVESINAVTLSVSDMRRSVAFYQSMGLDLAHGGENSSFTSFFIEGQALNLVEAGQDSDVADWGRVILYVTDVDAMHSLAVARGHSPESDPADASWGERFFHLDDPDGHQLSFARPL